MEMIVKIIDNKIKSSGMTQAFVSRQAHMNPDLLSRTLQGHRKLKADELVSLCEVLGLTFEDFKRPQAS